jgi:hypothetical protein
LSVKIEDGLSHSNSKSRLIDVVNGRAEFTVPAPGRFTMTAERLPGYIPVPIAPEDRAQQINRYEMSAGDEPYSITLPLERAGAVYGKVLNADGTPATEARIFVSFASAVWWPQDYRCSYSVNNLKCNAQGEFAVSPLPLGKTVNIAAMVDLQREVTAVTLSNAKPIDRIQLELPKGVDAVVRVYKPDGKPMGGVPLSLEAPGCGYTGHYTDSEGRFTFRAIDPKKKYTVVAKPDALYQQGSTELLPDKSENEIHLKEGLAIHVVLRFEETNKPVRDFMVRVERTPEPGKPYSPLGFEWLTNSEGEFALTNLQPGEYCVNTITGGFDFVTPKEGRTFNAGQALPVKIYVRPAATPKAQ